jgi:integrase
MSVFKRKPSPYYRYDFVFEGRRFQGSTKLTNKNAAGQAESILRAKLAQSRAGIVERTKVPIFRDFAPEFLERTKNEMRPNTSRGYRVSLGLVLAEDGKRSERTGMLLDWFGGNRLDEIRADEIERYKQSRLEQGRSPCTVNRDLACLRRILLFAVKLDEIPTTPFVAHKVKFLKENGRERILNFEEERKYLAAASQPLRDVATLIVELGLRPEEACSIRCEDVHFYSAPPFVHNAFGKTKNAVRDVPLTEKAREVLRRRVAAAQKKNGEYIFPLRVGNGHDWTRPMNELHPAHYDALPESKITPSFRIYDLRHTYGTRAIEGGTDPLTLMRLMGHADLKTTARYVHLSKRHLSEAQTRIERYRAEREIAEAEARKGEAGAVQ